MPVDILGILTTGMTIPGATTANLTGTGIDTGAGGALPVGTSRAPDLVARVLVSDAHNATGSNVLTWTIEHSSDNATWKILAGAALGANDDMTLTTAAQSREIFIPFVTSQRYYRLVGTITGAGTVPSVAVTAYLAPAFP